MISTTNNILDSKDSHVTFLHSQNCLDISAISDKHDGSRDGIFADLSSSHDFQSELCLLAWEKGQSSQANIQTTYDWVYQRTPVADCKIGSQAKRGKNIICQKDLGRKVSSLKDLNISDLSARLWPVPPAE